MCSSIICPISDATPDSVFELFLTELLLLYSDAFEWAQPGSLDVCHSVRVFGSGWQVEGRRGGGSRGFSPSISRVLVPLANTVPLCRLLPECNGCVLCQSRAVVAGPDRETSLAFTGLVSGGNGDRVGLHLGPVTQSPGILTSCAFPLGIITAAKDGFYLETWKL